MRRFEELFIVLFLIALPVGVYGQDTSRAPGDTARAWYEDSWTRIVEREGVEFHYLFYRKADNENDGIVIRLRNQNEYAVRYQFTVLFRAARSSAEAKARGVLGPRAVKTGDAAGLFWVPFREGQRIGEVGLRGIQITRADTTGASTRGVKAPWRTETGKTV